MKSRNFAAQVQSFRASETANAEFAVTHQLTGGNGVAATPRGAIVIRRSHAATLYESGTAWTTSTAYLKSSAANAQFKVLFFA